MIVFLLAVAAGGLLVPGLLSDNVNYSYGSLILGALALALFVVQVVRRRQSANTVVDERAEGETTEPAGDETATSTTDDAKEAPEEADEKMAAKPSTAPTVIVIRGRKRFHQRDCRHLPDREHDEIPRQEAIDSGFSPCMTCSTLESKPTEYANAV